MNLSENLNLPIQKQFSFMLGIEAWAIDTVNASTKRNTIESSSPSKFREFLLLFVLLNIIVATLAAVVVLFLLLRLLSRLIMARIMM